MRRDSGVVRTQPPPYNVFVTSFFRGAKQAMAASVPTKALAIPPEPAPLTTDSAGVVRVLGTRVTLDTVVAAFQEGATPEEIASQYPSLDLGDVYAVIAYYLRHRDEVERYLARRQEEAAAIRRENETRFEPSGIRARLLARQANRS
jgi:uncharacterized protein (DUF433 family)